MRLWYNECLRVIYSVIFMVFLTILHIYVQAYKGLS